MFDDVVELDVDSTMGELNREDWLLSVNLYKHPEFGYITVMTIPGEFQNENVTRVQQLPEAIQNMIPVYLPMILGD